MLIRLLGALAPLLLLGCAPHQIAPAQAAQALETGAVSAADPRAAQAGMEILRRGGSAADAAIATAIALTVVEPQSSGIGGGGFLVHHQAGGGLTSFDGRETAPMAAGPDLFLGPDGRPLGFGEAVPGGRSVGVPGNLRMFALAHSRHGRLGWAQLFEPAIRLARDGFELSPRMHGALARARHIEMTPFARRTYFQADGAPKSVGTRIRNPELAELLVRVAAHGADHFYVGPPARTLVDTVRGARRNPSAMTMGDLASYEAKEREPVCGTYRSHRICGMGPPSSGATTVFAILKQLERFDLARLGPDDPRAWHLFAESMRLAFADREAWLADPDFVAVPVAGLMDPTYLAERSRLIAADRAMASVAPGRPRGAPRAALGASAEVPSTSHLSVVDRHGNVAALTSTIEGPWGSGLTADGYFLNNELTDFSFALERNGVPVANRVEGGKRPRSSMSPTVAYAPDGSVRVAVGAAGGPTIIAQVAKALIGVIDWNLSAEEAIALPLIMGTHERVTFEQGATPDALVQALRGFGHDPQPSGAGLKANALERADGRWRGAADPRSEGLAIVE